MTGCNVIEATPEESRKDCGGEGHAGIMQGAGEAEQQSAQQGTAAQIFLAKTFRGFTTTASGSKFSDDSWDKIQDLTRS